MASAGRMVYQGENPERVGQCAVQCRADIEQRGDAEQQERPPAPRHSPQGQAAQVPAKAGEAARRQTRSRPAIPGE